MLYGTGKDLKKFNEANVFLISKDFTNWYYNREEYLRIYGEPSDSLMRDFKHEVDCMVMELAKWNGETVNGKSTTMTCSENDRAIEMFTDFWEDLVDEEAMNAKNTEIDRYLKEVKGCDDMTTCFVLGIITKCLKNDDYEEADLLARLYLGKAEHQKHTDWKNRQDTESGPMTEYPFNSHAYAVVSLMLLIVGKLKGDDPEIGVCITLCDSMYAEILEKEEYVNGKANM